MVVLFLLIGCLSPRDQPPVPQRAKQARLSTEEDAMRSKAVEKIVTIIPTRTASLDSGNNVATQLLLLFYEGRT